MKGEGTFYGRPTAAQLRQEHSGIKGGHRVINPAGTLCEKDENALEKAKVFAIGVSLDKPEVDAPPHIAVIRRAGSCASVGLFEARC